MRRFCANCAQGISDAGGCLLSILCQFRTTLAAALGRAGSAPAFQGMACSVVVTKNGRFAYTGNAASVSLSGSPVGQDGSLTLLDADGRLVAAFAPSGRLQQRRPHTDL